MQPIEQAVYEMSLNERLGWMALCAIALAAILATLFTYLEH